MKTARKAKKMSRTKLVMKTKARVAQPARSRALSRSKKRSSQRKMSEVKKQSRAMTREQFLEYIGYFNRKDFDGVTSYFAPDITVEYYDNATGPQEPARTLYGPQGFIENYRVLFSTVNEYLELGDFLSTEDRVFAELYTEFHCYKDTPAEDGRIARKQGDVQIMTNWVLYEMVDGKMKRIRIAHWRNHDPRTARYGTGPSQSI
jgi:hypothetical protein